MSDDRLIEATMEANGFEVIRARTGARSIRVWVDREPEGVGVDDLVTLTRALREALTEAGEDPDEFLVEVLSPGIDRELVRDKDFARFASREVTVRLKEKRIVENRRNYRGRLVGLEEGEVVVQGDDRWSFPRAEILEVRLVPQLATPAPVSQRKRKPRKARRKRPKEH